MHLYPLFIFCSVSETLISLFNEIPRNYSHTKLQQLLTFRQLQKHAELLQQSEQFDAFNPIVIKLWKQSLMDKNKRLISWPRKAHVRLCALHLEELLLKVFKKIAVWVHY